MSLRLVSDPLGPCPVWLRLVSDPLSHSPVWLRMVWEPRGPQRSCDWGLGRGKPDIFCLKKFFAMMDETQLRNYKKRFIWKQFWQTKAKQKNRNEDKKKILNQEKKRVDDNIITDRRTSRLIEINEKRQELWKNKTKQRGYTIYRNVFRYTFFKKTSVFKNWRISTKRQTKTIGYKFQMLN